MATYLDLRSGPRRDAFEHFGAFDQPFFSLCTRMDVAALQAELIQAQAQAQAQALSLTHHPGPGGFNLACHHIALRLANQHEPFRLRLEGSGPQARVRLHARVDASTTVLRADDSFGFAHLRYQPRFADFRAHAAAAMQAVRDGPAGFHEPPPGPQGDDAALMYFTTLPWVHFTSFAHARPGPGVPDSIPRVAFGRIDSDGGRRWLPVALDVHHALMDGVHAGRWLQALEAAFAEPQDWLT